MWFLHCTASCRHFRPTMVQTFPPSSATPPCLYRSFQVPSSHDPTIPVLSRPFISPSLHSFPHLHDACLILVSFLTHGSGPFPSFLATVCFTFFPFASTGCELQPSYNHRIFGAFWSRLQSSSHSDFQIRIIPSASLTDSDTNQPVTPTRPPNSPSFTCPPSVAWSNCCVLSHDTPPFHSFLALSCWPSFRTFALLPNNTARRLTSRNTTRQRPSQHSFKNTLRINPFSPHQSNNYH
jgi:hypothetical protein